MTNITKRGSISRSECRQKLGRLKASAKKLKNLAPQWRMHWSRVIGVVDYVDPMKAALRTRDIKFAVMPCQLKWSNNLMLVLTLPVAAKDATTATSTTTGKCLRFTAATEGELYVVIATTPSDQKTWYIFQISARGVIFYRVNKIHC